MKWQHIPPETETRGGCGGNVACMGLSTSRFCLNGLAWGHRGGLCIRMSLHRSSALASAGGTDRDLAAPQFPRNYSEIIMNNIINV